jgi:hypothetical protein
MACPLFVESRIWSDINSNPFRNKQPVAWLEWIKAIHGSAACLPPSSGDDQSRSRHSANAPITIPTA